jgi:hypothetical protein
MKKIISIFFIISLLFTGCSGKGRSPDVFLIPKDFKGWIQIVYNGGDDDYGEYRAAHYESHHVSFFQA